MKRISALLCLGVAGLACLAGCQQPLFPPDTPRSQFERYDVLRGRQRQVTQRGRFGADEVALRERLQPMEERW